jgi:hypothetical protein
MQRLFPRTALLLCLSVSLLAPSYAQTGTDATLTFAKEREQQARQQLRRLMSEYDLDPWLYTRTVKIEAGVIPHSHPLLTLNTSNLNADHEQLAVFLHEQIHWFEEKNDQAKERAIEELKAMYPNPPDHEKIGTRSEYSTYLHLIVNWLELDAMRHLIGEETARTLTDEDDIYQWVNQRVLEDTEQIGDVLETHDLIIDPTAE